MTPQAGEIWQYDPYDTDGYETWLVVGQVDLVARIDCLCFDAFCLETSDMDRIYYSETTACYWRRLA